MISPPEKTKQKIDKFKSVPYVHSENYYVVRIKGGSQIELHNTFDSRYLKHLIILMACEMKRKKAKTLCIQATAMREGFASDPSTVVAGDVVVALVVAGVGGGGGGFI